MSTTWERLRQRFASSKASATETVIAIAAGTTALTMVLMLVTHGMLVATASETSQNVSVSNPTIDWVLTNPEDGNGSAKATVHVTLSEPDGYVLSRNLGLSVVLVDGEGQTVADAKVVAPTQDADELDASFYRASAEVELDAEQCESVAGMRVVDEDEDGELDTQKFDKVSQVVTETAKGKLAEEREQALAAQVAAEPEQADAVPAEGEATDDGTAFEASVEEVLAWQDSDDIDRADLRISTDAEIEAWGRRIDDYLAGSELAGYGHLFAECAAIYQVDPRLSPAISTIESGKGAICADSCNAWGWGGPGNWASWGSWEEAIEGHVSGLANNGYASMGAEECARYCDWSYWDGDPSFCLKTEVLSI